MFELRKLIFGAIVLALLAFMTIGVQFKQFLSRPINISEPIEGFEINSGMSFSEVSSQLTALGLVTHPVFFQLYGRFAGHAGSLQAGEYVIEEGVTPAGLLNKFVTGDVRLYSFTAVEGWTFSEFLQRLGDHQAINKRAEVLDVTHLMTSLGVAENHPEGLFLPETYHFPKGTHDTEILKQSYSLMSNILKKEWDERALDLPITTPYEALILASIIEKETALADERPMIGGVFVRRLKAGMRLQTDPTVIYGLGQDFDGNLTRQHLRNDTPYNTYTRHGLPPTPIALPGRAAIRAALQPADGSALYFVATGKGDGSHKFSDTKEEHDQAVGEYLKRIRENRETK
ncbi:MAG: aminodeoxychorismate lyase [Woeseia sp.]|nr:aminodeoxychorismate lyase [Woeseia sp.]|tara:strand:+ start:2174 stop:3205 length:1032 start_codon:yes stop_codon:yes gene_type:complete